MVGQIAENRPGAGLSNVVRRARMPPDQHWNGHPSRRLRPEGLFAVNVFVA